MKPTSAINWRPSRRAMLSAIVCMTAGAVGWPVARNILTKTEASTTAWDGLVPLVYGSRYNITAFGLELLHPFDGQKYGKIQRELIHTQLRPTSDFTKPLELSRDQLLIVHTPEYLESLKDNRVLSQIFEISTAKIIPPFLLDWRVLGPMRLASGGTVLACRLALEHGLAINLGGGYHHADRNQGGGFCVYADIPLALTMLHQEGKIKNALIIDTDAHQGNGCANILHNSGWAHVVDFFDESIYPFPKVLEDISIPLPARTSGDKYLAALEKTVPEAISRFKPDLIVYNAGSDVLASDPLSSLLLTPQDMCQRDLFVVSQSRQHGIPLAMVLSGGYSKESASAHANSIESILATYDRKHS